jgi:hypothetical protein
MEQNKGKELGGSEDFSIYEKKDTRPYCEQLAHLLRSIYWSPQHLKARKVKEVIKTVKPTK